MYQLGYSFFRFRSSICSAIRATLVIFLVSSSFTSLLLAFSGLQLAGTRDAEGTASAMVPVGSTGARLVLNVKEPPAAGDSIQVSVNTMWVKTVLITPDHQRIDGDTAKSAGFKWVQGSAGPPPLGSTDFGQYTEAKFQKVGSAGEYVLDFTFEKLTFPAKLEARFISQMREYQDLIHATPSGQILGPELIAPAAILTVNIPAARDLLTFDILVTDSNVTVSVDLPDGRTLRPTKFSTDAASWDIEDTLDKSGQPTPFFSDMLIPVPGVHNELLLRHAAKGSYRIHAESNTASQAELRASVFSLQEIADAERPKFEPRLRTFGTAKIQFQPLPYECFVGDKVEIALEIRGDVGPQQPEFVVHMERRSWASETDMNPRLAPPDPVEIIPAHFTRDAAGAYRGFVQPEKPGMVRITVAVAGLDAAGKPFSDEVFVTNSSMRVKPVVARFLSLDFQPIGRQGSSMFDSLEVTANLDVFEPGDYSMHFVLRDAQGRQLEGPGQSGRARLEKGRQHLLVSVPAPHIWKDLRNGPFEISPPQISRTAPSTILWVGVPTGESPFHTPAYTREQWNPGPIFGEDQVDVHGIARLPSGRFLFAEAVWEVNTPGGQCQWQADFRNPTAMSAPGSISMPSARGEGKLKPGRTKISLFFDGADLNSSRSSEWEFMEWITCGASTYPTPPLTFHLSPAPKIRFHPEDYEPPGSLAIRSNHMARLAPGGSARVTLSVNKTAPDQAQFSLKSVPDNIQVALSESRETTSSSSIDVNITALRDSTPVRSFVTVEVICGDRRATTEIVVDIVSP